MEKKKKSSDKSTKETTRRQALTMSTATADTGVAEVNASSDLIQSSIISCLT